MCEARDSANTANFPGLASASRYEVFYVVGVGIQSPSGPRGTSGSTSVEAGCAQLTTTDSGTDKPSSFGAPQWWSMRASFITSAKPCCRSACWCGFDLSQERFSQTWTTKLLFKPRWTLSIFTAEYIELTAASVDWNQCIQFAIISRRSKGIFYLSNQASASEEEHGWLEEWVSPSRALPPNMTV
jgi:hypothetical protein